MALRTARRRSGYGSTSAAVPAADGAAVATGCDAPGSGRGPGPDGRRPPGPGYPDLDATPEGAGIWMRPQRAQGSGCDPGGLRDLDATPEGSGERQLQHLTHVAHGVDR